MKMPIGQSWRTDLHGLYEQLCAIDGLTDQTRTLNARGLRLFRWLRRRYRHKERQLENVRRKSKGS